MAGRTREEWLARRREHPSARSSREWSLVDPRIRAQTFFSARVAEARILSKIREISDQYSSGQMTLNTARSRLREWLASPEGGGYDLKNTALSNLASTARINLILRQNALMAAAVGQYEEETRSDNLELWPYWRYVHDKNGRSKTPRDDHRALDGKIFRKDDPIWHQIFPPRGFNCRCGVEQVDEEAAEEAGGVQNGSGIQVPAGTDGFQFDPIDAFADIDLSRIEAPDLRNAAREELELELGDQVTQSSTFQMRVEPHAGYQSYTDVGLDRSREWQNLPEPPPAIQPEEARARLEKGFSVQAGDGEEVTLGQSVLDHWEIEKNKGVADIKGRLARLDMAIATVENPVEVWQQDTQKAYVKLFEKPTGGKTGCAVFVRPDGKARTYFPKDPNGLDKCRKGISCISFIRQPETGEPAEVAKLREINRNLVEVRARLQKLLREAEARNMPPETIEKIRDLLRQAVPMKYFPGKSGKED